jgi:hypothetical protein
MNHKENQSPPNLSFSVHNENSNVTGNSLEGSLVQPEKPLFYSIGKATHDALLSGKTAAKIINVAPQTLAQWRVNRRVDIPFVRVGRRVMYRRADLEAFITANVCASMQSVSTGDQK